MLGVWIEQQEEALSESEGHCLIDEHTDTAAVSSNVSVNRVHFLHSVEVERFYPSSLSFVFVSKLPTSPLHSFSPAII